MAINNSLKRFSRRGKQSAERTRDIFVMNPTVPVEREQLMNSHIHVFDFSSDYFNEAEHPSTDACYAYKDNGRVTWINVGGIKKEEVENICSHFAIHYLIYSKESLENILENIRNLGGLSIAAHPRYSPEHTIQTYAI